MKIVMLISLILLISINKANAQVIAEPAPYKKFIKQFVEDFNTQQYSHIILNASPAFLKSVPERKLSEFLKGIKDDNGKIKLVHFKYIDQKGSAVYHTELEKTWLNFIIGLNDSSMLKRLIVLDPNYNEDLPISKNKTKMLLPFNNEWTVFWGGDSEDENYHVTVRSQKNAFDFMIRDTSDRSFKTDGKTNEDYYAFGQNLYSPCDGEVVKVIDSVHDNVPGVMNPQQLTGNIVIIKSLKNEYILMAHFKNQSIKVKEGSKIKAGNFLGLCGNSGNSSEPHLHLHIMDKPELKNATGIKCYFDKLIVNGNIKTKYSPVRKDRIEKIK